MNINTFQTEVEGEIIMDQEKIIQEISKFYKKKFKDDGVKQQ